MTVLMERLVPLDVALAALEDAVGLIQAAALDGLSPAEELALIGRLEVLRRRLDHGTDRAAGHLDRSAAFSFDGHKTANGALKAIGRLSGSEAHGRVQTSRALRHLPLVEAAYGRGEIPTEHVRAHRPHHRQPPGRSLGARGGSGLRAPRHRVGLRRLLRGAQAMGSVG